MQQYQIDFIEFALEREVLRFGEFTLKSGRTSPYFFNAGLFQTGKDLAKLGNFYAEAIYHSGIDYDVLFGPAYKGIPLVSAASIALANNHGLNKPYCFNRKEAKDHGEGGSLVGSSVNGKVLIIDDVITAGTAIREAVSIINNNGGQPAGVMVALDRQEKGQSNLSAIQEVERDYNIPVVSIIKLNELIQYLADKKQYTSAMQQIEAYRNRFGIDILKA